MRLREELAKLLTEIHEGGADIRIVLPEEMGRNCALFLKPLSDGSPLEERLSASLATEINKNELEIAIQKARKLLAQLMKTKKYEKKLQRGPEKKQWGQNLFELRWQFTVALLGLGGIGLPMTTTLPMQPLIQSRLGSDQNKRVEMPPSDVILARGTQPPRHFRGAFARRTRK